MAQHGKRYRQRARAIDRERLYTPVEAIRALKAFDSRSSTRRSRCTSGSA